MKKIGIAVFILVSSQLTHAEVESCRSFRDAYKQTDKTNLVNASNALISLQKNADQLEPNGERRRSRINHVLITFLKVRVAEESVKLSPREMKIAKIKLLAAEQIQFYAGVLAKLELPTEFLGEFYFDSLETAINYRCLNEGNNMAVREVIHRLVVDYINKNLVDKLNTQFMY